MSRKILSGILSPTSSFRIYADGDVGTKELSRLIQKLQLEKEIIATPKENTVKGEG